MPTPLRLLDSASLRVFSIRMFVGLLLLCGASKAHSQQSPTRIADGLLVFYDFRAFDGSSVKDTAGIDPPMDLRVSDSKVVKHRDTQLEVLGTTLLHTEKPASRLSEAIKSSRSVTIETWFRPAKLDQSGPARIVTLSRNTSERNFTLGQEGDNIEVRFRTTKTSTNGMPGLVSKPKSLTADWTHIVYTFDRTGKAKLYINGSLNVEQSIGGDLSNWDDGLHFALANELTNDRPWLGSIRLVAIYGHDLLSSEIEQNFRAGMLISPPSADELLAQQQHSSAKLFETKIAPLISQHCLECHDAATKKGKLDLSRRAGVLASGGNLLVAGKPTDSLLWQKIESDEMPHDRPPLSPDEKKLLRQWIEGGATWSLDFIDPAVYTHGDGAQKVFAQRLTVPEYIETVRHTLGVDISKEAREVLPRDLRADGFSNTAYNLNVDLGHVEAYAKLAELIVSRFDVKSLSTKHTKSRELTDENVTKVILPLGRQLLRGPISKNEVALYCGISSSVAAAGGSFDDAIRYIVEAMLQSPRFLYRIEQQQGDGSPRSVDSMELASRLSYILWGGPPDDALLQAAEKKALDRVAVESQARRMLQDRRAVDRSRQFVSEWLNLGRLDNLRPDPKRFPNWDPRLAADMREETLAFFEEIVWEQNRPLSDLLNAQVTFVTPRLAKHYGMPSNMPITDDKAVRVDLSNIPSRGGLLTHGSVLTAGGDEASMVTRGLFLMNELMRGVVRDPPPGTDTTPTPSKPGLTQRLVAEQRIANKNCTGCHVKFEPLAFGLEKFDGLGTFHETDEHGNKLRDDGSVLFPGDEKPIAYKTSRELMDLLAKSERVRESFTWKVTQFALGRPLRADDAPAMADIHRRAQDAGGTYPQLMTAIVTSELVLKTRTEKSP